MSVVVALEHLWVLLMSNAFLFPHFPGSPDKEDSCSKARAERGRGRLKPRHKFTKDDLKILQQSFEQDRYPDFTTKENLAQECRCTVYVIETWFQKNRKIKKQVEFECCFEESQAQGKDKPKVKEAGRRRTRFSNFQTDILIEAFEKNRFPGIVTREKLAQQTGIPESRIHIWFQNRRARHPGPKQGTQATTQPSRNSQCPALKTTDQPAPSKTLTSHLSLTIALSPPHTLSGPSNLSRGHQKQLSSTTGPQLSQVVQGRGDGQNSSACIDHLSPVVTPGEEGFHTQTPLCLQIQERQQDPGESSGSALPPLDSSAQAPAVNQHFRELDQTDFAFLQHWDEWLQSMLAEWIPDEEYWTLGDSVLHPQQAQLQQPASVSHQVGTTPQQ
ncbi:double homeobox protein 4C-like [Microtus ochrogaster]|uniref:Double homeobox protein 4C-like n=1 Tax=Microtus ochrogaster TaxID=79684 RepID=A0ABM0KLJ3_MICOH|nr:double homeobox protein 4C-like [Microtus ochrogaster]